MTRQEIQALVTDFVATEHHEAQLFHTASATAPKLIDRVKQEEIQRFRLRALVEDDLAKGRVFHAHEYLADFLERRGAPVTDETLRTLAFAWLAVLSGNTADLPAAPRPDPQPPAPAVQTVEPPRSTHAPEAERPKAKRVWTIGELIDPHIRERQRSGIGASWQTEIRTALSWLTAWFGDSHPVDEITTADMRDLKEALLELPAGWSKKPQFKGMHIRDIAAQNRTLDLPRLDVPALVGKRWNPIVDFLAWAHANSYAPTNPAETLKIEVSRRARTAKKRDEFDVAGLQTIFNAPLYRGMESKEKWWEPGSLVVRDARFWVPLLAAFTGCRRSELCQLRTDDIVVRDGVLCLFIRERFDEDGEQITSVKNEDSVRLVPVHSELIRAGFPEFAEQQRADGKVRLFDLPEARNYDQFGKWFARFITRLGIKTKRNCFHSFRHCMEQAMRENIDDWTARFRITGRTNRHSSEIYGKGHTVATLVKEMAKVKYDGLDLSHLYIR